MNEKESFIPEANLGYLETYTYGCVHIVFIIAALFKYFEGIEGTFQQLEFQFLILQLFCSPQIQNLHKILS